MPPVDGECPSTSGQEQAQDNMFILRLSTNGQERALLPYRGRGAARRARVRDMDRPPPAFRCLKQDGQDAQDAQDDSHSPRSNRALIFLTRCKGLEDLNVYRTEEQQAEKVR